MDFCENLHMNLVTIESAEENKAVEKFITDANGGNEYWTAGTRLLDGKTWLWFTTGDVIQYTAWNAGEPSGGNEYCLITIKSNNGLVWNDVKCDLEYPFVCERPIDEKREDLFANEEKDWQNILNVHKNQPNLDRLHVNGKEFYISQEYRGNYYEALDYCQVHNMRLASIDSKEENDRLYRHIRDISAGTDFWSSGTRLLDGRNWVWLPKGLPVGYTNWGPGQPDNNNDHCIRLHLDKNNGLFWDDINCN
uniref:Perlucin-like n=1 Tax=Diabrotica virgifera virgifera TaxID=50390 RepID=A0A6P7GDS6_DIAVI